MSTANISSVNSRMTEEYVIQMIAEALDVPIEKLNSGTKSTDIPEWDSMGILSILSSLDREGVTCDLGRAESLQSVAGVLDVIRSAGRLE